MSHPYEAFQAALEKLINDSKRGTQTDLRKFLKTTPNFCLKCEFGKAFFKI